jgi:hypothetical protein
MPQQQQASCKRRYPFQRFGKKSVRFEALTEVIPLEREDFFLTEAGQKTLWYRKKDLLKIKQKIDDTVKSVDSERCLRGLEYQISDRLDGEQSRRKRMTAFRQRLLESQDDLSVDELAHFSSRHSE